MLKKVLLFFLVLMFTIPSFAQLQSPEQFLGYKIGTRYTPHWRIVDYYKHVAAAVPSMVKLQPYGQTTEGRPLLLAYVSSPENISNVEIIRTSNLKAATTGNAVAASTPVIVWLSYNVHGNEPASSEAAMQTLFALVDPTNTQTKTWLQNTLVIMDPCLNPDGRDRYVNWFNSVAGATPNPSLMAREHREPWPGGRTNHYNFDLNRDWAWQTQIETQQRLRMFNNWLPQVHVDFHEQGINSPYYFAPAAEPFHQVITPWQRRFQELIGRNHAKYFDQNGWLYFTKERFDLLYPSYGDTYPLYNGAIGMTYEQGGIGGGTTVMLENGDTLTLADRVQHHYTTGLSTIEVASQNAAKLQTEFSAFYKNAITNGIGLYKAFVIKNTNTNADAERIAALQELLRKNKIEFGYAKSGAIRGFNYDDGKEESMNTDAGDLVIPTTQSRGTLVDVLFEPSTKLSDSITYDITAWSLPYVYGLKTIASKATVPFTKTIEGNLEVKAQSLDITSANTTNTSTESYGYIIRWSGVQSVKLVSQLLQHGIKLRFSEQPFQSGNQSFDRGAVIVLKTSNQYYPHLWDTVRQVANRYNVPLTSLASGFVDKGSDFGGTAIHSLVKRRVALVTGEGISSQGAGEVWHFFDQVLQYPITLINANDLSRADWSAFDVLIMPDGNYRFLTEKTSADALKNWITNGGNVIALEGAVAQLAKQDWSIKSKTDDDSSNTKNQYGLLKKFESRERDEVSGTTPGSIYKVELDNTHPLAFGYPAYYYTLKQDDAIYEFLKDGWNVGVLKKTKPVAGFVGSKLSGRLQNGLLFGVQDIGHGTVTYLADDVLFRSFWENGKLLFCNAVFLVGQ